MQAHDLKWHRLLALGLFGSIFLASPAFSVPVEIKAKESLKSAAKSASDSASKSESKTYPNTVLGDWTSEWGPVKFSKSGSSISGQWEEGKDKIGKIDSGVFDEKTGSFKYNFVETWTGFKGKADLKLSADHSQLSGNWVRGKDKGTWSMKRSAK